jgi:hypothetical protein
MTEVTDSAGRTVFVCDGCSSWTDKPVTRAELVADYGWIEDAEDDLGEVGYVPVYCSECQ